jgi:hypothetical protein
MVTSAIVFFSDEFMAAIASLMPFAAASVGAFVFLGLTQETKTHYPMTGKRSLWYTGAVVLIVFGLFISAVVFFQREMASLSEVTGSGASVRVFENINIVAALGTLIPFVLPGAAFLAVLVLSEKDRKKPWVHRMEEEQSQIYGERFGLIAGALWIFAIALFIILTGAVGLRYSWLTFLFAAAVQLLIMSVLGRKKG